MPLNTINEKPVKKAKKTDKKKVFSDSAKFVVVGHEGGLKLIHHWTGDNGTAETTEITGLCTAGELRAVKVDIEDFISRGMIRPAQVLVDAE